MPLIENLLALYTVDRQVRSLRGRVESAQIYLRVQEKQIADIDVERKEIEQQLKQRKSNIALIETETGSIDDRIVHLREELNNASNDKQYSALLAEVNTLKERRKAFEEEELQEMASSEELEGCLTEIQDRWDERQKVVDSAKQDLETREKEISEQLEELESERKTASALIPEATLEQFDSIADDFDGEAMAAIEVLDQKRKEYGCTSCSLQVPLNSITKMLGHPDDIVTCVSCDRILYLENETKEAIASK
tara:strand:+ start:260 stop:1012 length:753 start_codon:yes stop_codon:yes gene_type:complete